VNFDQQMIALDLCASPGGKSTLLSSLLHEDSLLVSNEVIQNRVSSLCENLCKWGQLNTWVTASDPKHFTALANMFDVVLVDAPCSGSGLFRKLPDYVNQWTSDMVRMCSQRQERILHDVFPSIKDEGLLVYMTCSFSLEENENMVDYILQNFDVDTCQIHLSEEWGIVETISEKRHGYGYRFFPHLLEGEGFFLACFRNKSINRPQPILANVKAKINTHDINSIVPYVDLEKKTGITFNGHLFLVNAIHTTYAEYFGKYLKLIKKGVFCGRLIRGELIPEHELAMYVGCQRSVDAIELLYNEAIMYLQKEHIDIQCPHKGWFLVRYEGHNLGWIKNIGNRVNNYYPSAYRILNKNILTT
jgi:NOL1/NOP2/fmu family ribosome biogenesis protein